MPLTREERQNEHLKLMANWTNTLATAIVTAGCFVPAAQEIFGFLPQGTSLALVYGTGAICVGVGVLLHLLGHLILRGLQ